MMEDKQKKLALELLENFNRDVYVVNQGKQVGSQKSLIFCLNFQTFTFTAKNRKFYKYQNFSKIN